MISGGIYMVGQVVCNLCDKRCVINIHKEENNYLCEGNLCDKGMTYGNEYMRSSSKIFTSVVRVKDPTSCNVVPVKSSKPIDISLWMECSKALGRIYVGLPIKIGDVICKNIVNSGVDIICTKNVDKKI
jgi:CxxC motif-containing protein